MQVFLCCCALLQPAPTALASLHGAPLHLWDHACKDIKEVYLAFIKEETSKSIWKAGQSK